MKKVFGIVLTNLITSQCLAQDVVSTPTAEESGDNLPKIETPTVSKESNDRLYDDKITLGRKRDLRRYLKDRPRGLLPMHYLPDFQDYDITKWGWKGEEDGKLYDKRWLLTEKGIDIDKEEEEVEKKHPDH